MARNEEVILLMDQKTWELDYNLDKKTRLRAGNINGKSYIYDFLIL